MEFIVLLVIAGYALYGIYLLLLYYGHIVVPAGLAVWLIPIAVRYYSLFHTRLKDHKRAENQQQDLFVRFSDKKRYLFALHWLTPVMAVSSFFIANGAMKNIRELAEEEDWIHEIPRDYRFLEEPFYWLLFVVLVLGGFYLFLKLFNAQPFRMKLFPSYNALRRHADNPPNPHMALEHAHALREAAKHHVTRPYDFFVLVHALFSKPNTAFYKSERLSHVLLYLEKNFPYVHEDEDFRRRYWNYARHIFALLHFRGDALTEISLFALPYPEEIKVDEQDMQNALQKEREKFQNAPLDVWSKSPSSITLEDALEVIGLSDIPSIKILHKLHLAVLDEHKDDPQKANITAKAFEILGREVVRQEMSSPKI